MIVAKKSPFIFIVVILLCFATPAHAHHSELYTLTFKALEEKDFSSIKPYFPEELWSNDNGTMTAEHLEKQVKASAFTFALREGTGKDDKHENHVWMAFSIVSKDFQTISQWWLLAQTSETKPPRTWHIVTITNEYRTAMEFLGHTVPNDRIEPENALFTKSLFEKVNSIQDLFHTIQEDNDTPPALAPYIDEVRKADLKVYVRDIRKWGGEIILTIAIPYEDSLAEKPEPDHMTHAFLDIRLIPKWSEPETEDKKILNWTIGDIKLTTDNQQIFDSQ